MAPIGGGYRSRYPLDTMGLLSDFFIATPDVAQVYAGSGLPPQDICSVGGITPLEVAAIVAALRGVDDDVAIVDEFESLRPEREEEWLMAVPHDMVDLLAAVEDARVPELSAKIAATVSEEGPVPDDTFEPMLGELAALAQRAKATGKAMYFWMSL